MAHGEMQASLKTKKLRLRIIVIGHDSLCIKVMKTEMLIDACLFTQCYVYFLKESIIYMYKPGNMSSILLVEFSDRTWCRLLEDFDSNI